MIIPYKGNYPVISKRAYIAPSAVIIGDVVIEDDASVWFGAILRGDLAQITIGSKTSVQDNCTLHVDVGCPLTIASNVIIGHNAVVHGCRVADNVLIGIHSTVLTKAVLHEGSVVAAGAVVSEGFEVGPRQLAAGVPATIKKTYDEERARIHAEKAGIYYQLLKDYRRDEL